MVPKEKRDQHPVHQEEEKQQEKQQEKRGREKEK
jgi:hypothetical protein